jgi:hypothetical protein
MYGDPDLQQRLLGSRQLSAGRQRLLPRLLGSGVKPDLQRFDKLLGRNVFRDLRWGGPLLLGGESMHQGIQLCAMRQYYLYLPCPLSPVSRRKGGAFFTPPSSI